MNCAYCTLVSNDEYAWGAACLSISKSIINTKYPLVIMVSEIVSEENKKLLSNYGIVKIIPNHIFEYGDNDFYKCTKQKLEVFNLTEYDRVCFLDADMLMLESLDYELENNAFMFDIRERYAKDLNRFAVCGEVFIVTPDSSTFDMLIDIADKNKLNNDEECLAYIYKEEFLSPIMNGQLSCLINKTAHMAMAGRLFLDIEAPHYSKHGKYWTHYDMNDDIAKLLVYTMLTQIINSVCLIE